MNHNGGNKSSKLLEFYNWPKRVMVDKMLDDGVNATQCANWCNDNGFEISVPTMYKYAARRKEAAERGVDIRQIFDKRFGPDKVKPKLVKKMQTGRKKQREQVKRAKDNLKADKKRRVLTDLELLDAIIQKGIEKLEDTQINPSIAIKAIELKYKITGGSHNGLTVYGLEEIRLREQARETAMLNVMMEFIPDNLHQTILDKMENTTKEFYEKVGLGKHYAQYVDMDESTDDEEEETQENLE